MQRNFIQAPVYRPKEYFQISYLLVMARSRDAFATHRKRIVIPVSSPIENRLRFGVYSKFIRKDGSGADSHVRPGRKAEDV
jgi:hypothetical protein